jgi:hypothetical protein
VPIASLDSFVGLVEFLQGVLADGLQHHEPRLSSVRIRAEEALRDERLDPVENTDVLVQSRQHLVCGHQCESPGEHGQRAEDLLLLG